MSAASRTCDLCGLPILGRAVRTGGPSAGSFCCEGCRRVWTVAEDLGIEGLASGLPADRALRAREAARRKAAAAAAAGARRSTLRVDGMWCSSCADVLSEALLDIPGVLDAEVSYAASLARVTYDPAATSGDAAAARIGALGYRASPGGLASESGGESGGDSFLRFFVSAAAGMWVMWLTLFLLYPSFVRGSFAGLQPVELFTGAMSLAVLLFGGAPFIRGAWHAARAGRATMDTLVVLGTWTAWGYSLFAAVRGTDATYFESAAMITTIVMLGRWLEELGRRGAAGAIGSLSSAAPAEVWAIPEGGGLADAVRVGAGTVSPGDLLAVRAGERFPVDGVVAVGRTTADHSRLTGEPLPVERAEDDEVWAGAINLSEAVVVRATRVGPDTLADRIAALVEDAAFAKSHAERVADVAAGIFVPVVLTIAAATLLLTAVSGPGTAEAIRRAVAVLVVACPCALGLATPLAVLEATARVAAAGVVVRGGEAFERAGAVGVVALDKTGTLTEGRPEVAAFLPAAIEPADATRMLEVAAAVESGGAHPAAAAIAVAARRRSMAGARPPGAAALEATSVVTHPGLGVEGSIGGHRVIVGSATLLALEGICVGEDTETEGLVAASRGDSVVWVAEGGRCLGGLVLADPVRPEAARVVKALHAAGLRTVMVTGDGVPTAQAVAATLGIDEVRAGILPHDKGRVVRELSAGTSVAFVGDGINDAPALAEAGLAVAVGDASDIAVRAADVVLVGVDGAAMLDPLPLVLRTARRTRRVVRQNLAWAFSYNLVAIPLAVTGALSPVAAAAAMALSSLAVVANSARLRWR